MPVVMGASPSESDSPYCERPGRAPLMIQTWLISGLMRMHAVTSGPGSKRGCCCCAVRQCTPGGGKKPESRVGGTGEHEIGVHGMHHTRSIDFNDIVGADEHFAVGEEKFPRSRFS